MLRILVFTLLLFAVFSCSPQEAEDPGDAETYAIDPEQRPNIIVIVVDDLRWDELGVAGHPFLQTPNIDGLASEGAFFSNAFHSVPLCSPNRATILTGQYPSRHGIIDNVARNRMSHRLVTFPQTLQEEGYRTAYLGKWHMGNDPTPRPGFDEWVAIPGQGRTMNPELFEDGRIHEVPGYITDVLTDRAIEFIQLDREGPFFIYIGHKAIHPDAVQLDDGSVDLTVPRGYVPAPRHRGLYEEEDFPRRPNAITSLSELDDKPALQHALSVKNSREIVEEFGEDELDPGSSDETIRRRAEMLLAVDESVGRIVEALEAEGILDDTFVLFTSDNGFFYGEHGLSLERRMPYEESIRTPLIIRYPRIAQPGAQIEALVASVDIAPSVLEVAGAPIGTHIQGQSFIPSLMGSTRGARASVFVEFFTYENPFPWLLDMDYRAIRTDRYKYIHWMQYPEWGELYDLQEDPFEIRNLVDDPAMESVLEELREELRAAALHAMGLSG
jgi:N-acetylglucosamine-6-sulfatase